MQKVLIDTDVILDFNFDRQPYSNDAAQILFLAEKKSIEAFISPVIISNLYYILRKTASHDKVLMQLSSLLEVVEIGRISKDVVLQAINSKFNDFEDALQNFSAIQEGVNILITRNVKDYKKSELIIATPSVYLKSLIQMS